MTEKKHRVSASQIKTYRECARKWGFRYIDGIETPPNASAALGSEVHAVLEGYLRGERTLNDATEQDRAVNIARAAIPHLPAPIAIQTHWVEKKLDFEVDGINFVGFIDLLWVDPDTGGVAVYDHKTSRDPGKWGLTEDELREDVQAMIYATWAMSAYEVPLATLQWTYLRTQGKPIAIPVRTTVELDHVFEQFAPILDTAKEIVEKKRETVEANDLPPSPEACGNFGGCPFAQFCVRTTDQRLGAIFNEKNTNGRTMPSLQEMLAKTKKAAAPEKKKAPPRVGRTINAPETEDMSVEKKREISRGIETVSKTGNRDQKDDKAHAVAVAGVKGEDVAATAAKLQGDEAADKAARKSPSKDELLRLVVSGEQRRFAPTSKSATKETPYCSGRTLNALKKDGFVNFRRMDDGSYSVMPTDKARAEVGEVETVEAPVKAEAPAIEFLPENTEEREVVGETNQELDKRDPVKLARVAIGEALDHVLISESTGKVEFDDATEATYHLRKALSVLGRK